MQLINISFLWASISFCRHYHSLYVNYDIDGVVSHVYFTAENRKILHEQEVEKMLIQLLIHDDFNVQIAAAQALGVMAENLSSRDIIGQWGELIKVVIAAIYFRHYKTFSPFWRGKWTYLPPRVICLYVF